MRVDQFSTFVVGGAAVAARRLHDSLRKLGVESRFWHGPSSELDHLDESYSNIRWPLRRRSVFDLARRQIRRTAIRSRFKRAMDGRPEGLESFTLPELAAPTPYPPGPESADIVQLHWIANLIDYSSFFSSLPDDLPVIWTLHDMNPFTGGCHYSNECPAFSTQCRDCPQIAKRGSRDLSNRNFRIKQESIRSKNLHVVAPSHWLLGEAQNSFLFRDVKSMHRIPYGLDTTIFTPHDKQDARRQLGLPRDRFVIAFVAEAIDNHRKGAKHLMRALSHLSDRGVQGLVLGGGQLPESQFQLPPLTHIGFERNPRRQAMIYSAADVLLLPSLADNLPLTGLEALACGTPVIGFDVGGIADYVKEGTTGLLVPAGDSLMLAEKISWLIEREEVRRQMGSAGRHLIESEFREEIQANRYLELYESLLESSRVQLKQAS